MNQKPKVVSFLKTSSTNFVPISRTPWGGSAIPHIKSRQIALSPLAWPRVGESWEVSTDAQFPSALTSPPPFVGQSLLNVLELLPQGFLGEHPKQGHCPLLLKWLHAQDVLSVQVHPNDTHADLSPSECGKPESWLVLSKETEGYVYLGFKEELTQEDIINCLLNDKPLDCLYRYEPKTLDYISVPTGLVHAVGPGVLLAEPQRIVAGKSGKTWRISDWGRKYNAEGELCPFGQLRELHTQSALSAVDFSLPRGKELERLFVRNMQDNSRFAGDAYNPFAVHVFSLPGKDVYHPLVPGKFSIITVWSGSVLLRSPDGECLSLEMGESALISGQAQQIELFISTDSHSTPGIAFFSLRDED